MIYTFYSFKGGVGRSMSLVNVAELMYKKGLNVLVIDFDLEAPGLERYFNTPDALTKPEDVLNCRGVIDMLMSYLEIRELNSLAPSNSMRMDQSNSDEWFPYPREPLKNFITPIYEGKKGGISLMPSGIRSGDNFQKYAQRVNSFNWQRFYADWDGGLFFNKFIEEVKKQFDIILIDSRTGITEMSGICTHHLADAVVFFVISNDQAMEGTTRIVKSLNNPSALIKQLREVRNENQPGKKEYRPQFYLFIPSRIALVESGDLNKFANAFNQAFSEFIPKQITIEYNLFQDFKIPYVAHYSYSERIAARDYSQAIAADLIKVFEKLSNSMAKLAPEGSNIAHTLIDWSTFGSTLEHHSQFQDQISDTTEHYPEEKMEGNLALEAVQEAYNNFDLRALEREALNKFYVNEIAKEYVEDIKFTIEMSKEYSKILIIGHKGSGKSSILNKVAEEMENKFHIVSYSSRDLLGIPDLKSIDILLFVYMEILKSMKNMDVDSFLKSFATIMDFIKKNIDIKMSDLTELDKIAGQILINNKFRIAVREGLNNQMAVLMENISSACKHIYSMTQKEVLIFIDNLDKLLPQVAEQIFFTDCEVITKPDVKIVYTFPLESFYNDSFNKIKDKFDHKLISPVKLFDFKGNYMEESYEVLKKMILKRIDKRLITEKAIKLITYHSGGLLREVVRLMQLSCKKAILNKSLIIDSVIAQLVINEYVNDFIRFSSNKFDNVVREIIYTKHTANKQSLNDLLDKLFVIEYRDENNIWYDLHPCYKESLTRKTNRKYNL